MGKKRLLIAILFTFLTLFFLKNLSIVDYVSSEDIEKKARVDIFFAGDKDNQIFWEENANKQMKFQRPSWFQNPKWMSEPGNGIVIEYPISDTWQKDIIQLKLKGKGDLKVYFRAPDYKNIQVKYKDATVNGKDIFSGTKYVSFKNFYSFNEKNTNQDITLSVQASQIKTQYDFAIFFSLLIIFFAFYYKIIQYLAKFKIIEHNSRIDIVFLSVFFVLLLIPMSHINQDEKSTQENRMLAKYVPLIDNQGHLNLKYGKNFEAWFNDRFNFRKDLLNLYTDTLLSINKFYQNSSSIRLKDNWLFNFSELKVNHVSEIQLKEIKKGILSLKDFCKKNNIKCYIELVPSKIEFAQNKTFILDYDYHKEEGFIIQKNLKDILPIIYPREEMLSANMHDNVYFKTDHHWTEWGAYIGYLALIKEIKKDFPQVNAVSEKEYDIFYSNQVRSEFDRQFWSGLTCQTLNLNKEKCVLDQAYKYYAHKQEKSVKLTQKQDIKYKYFQNSLSANNLKVVVLGNSFAENVVSFLPYTFREVKKYRINTALEDNLKLSRWKKEIEEYKPDILIVWVHSRYSLHLSDLKD